MRERDVEQAFARKIRAAGGLCDKFTSPGKRSVPDRLVIAGDGLRRAADLLCDLLEEARSADLTDHFLTTDEGRREAVRGIISEVIYFVEMKAPGKKPTPLQERDHQKRRELGLRVLLWDGVEWGGY